MDTLFKVIYFAGIIAQVILRYPHEQQRRGIQKTGQRVSGTEGALLAGIAIGEGVLPAIYSLTAWLDFANYRWPRASKARAGLAGTLLLGASVWLFGRSHNDLGKNWSPSLEIRAQQELITHGVYRFIRHPMYASQLLWGFAQGLLLHNWIAGWSSLAAFLPLYFLRMPQEERMMLDHFGEQYRAYSEETGRILPRVAR